MKHRTINRLLSGILTFCFLSTLITVPSSAAVVTDGLVTNTTSATYSFEGDAWGKEASFTYGGNPVWGTSNAAESTATLTMNITVPDGVAVSIQFDYAHSTDVNDKFTVIQDSEPILTESTYSCYPDSGIITDIGGITNWQTKTLDFSAGNHSITWSFERGEGFYSSYFSAYIKTLLSNIRITPSVTSYPFNVTYDNTQGTVAYQLEGSDAVPVASGASFDVSREYLETQKKSVALIATPGEDYLFSAWYDSKDNKLSAENSVKVSTPGEYRATFIPKDAELPGNLTIRYTGLDGQPATFDFSDGDKILEQPLSVPTDFTVSMGSIPASSTVTLYLDNDAYTDGADKTIYYTQKNHTIRVVAEDPPRNPVTRTVEIYWVKEISELNKGADNVTLKTEGQYPWRYDLPTSQADGTDVFSSTVAEAPSRDSVLAVTVTKPGALLFDYKVSSDTTAALLYSKGKAPTFDKADNTADLAQFQGKLSSEWHSWSIPVTQEDLSGGSLTIYLSFVRRGAPATIPNDISYTAWLSNLRYSNDILKLNLKTEGADSSLVTGSSGSTILSGNSQADIPAGSSVTVTAGDAPAGSTFYGWQDEAGKTLSLNSTYTFSMARDSTVIAKYAPTGTYAAICGNDYYSSLEDALLNSSSGDTVTLLQDYTLEKSVSVPSGVLLLLPCDAAGTAYTSTGYNPNGGSTVVRPATPYRMLTIPSGISLDVSGTILVNAVTGVSNANTDKVISGEWSTVTLDGSVNVESGGIFDVCGTVTGNGNIHVKNGGELRDLFVVRKWRGGSVAAATYAYNPKICPYNEYDCHNIEVDTRIDYGAIFSGTTKMYGNNSYHYTRFEQIGSGGLIRLTNPDSYLVKSYDKSTQRTTIQIFGGAETGSGKLSVAGVTIATNQLLYPIDGDISFELYNGQYTIGQTYKFLTGSSLLVGEDAILTVAESGKLMFYQEFTDDFQLTSTRYPVRSAARLLLDGGKIEILGTVGAVIETTSTEDCTPSSVYISNEATLALESKESKTYTGSSIFTKLTSVNTFTTETKILYPTTISPLQTGTTYWFGPVNVKYTLSQLGADGSPETAVSYSGTAFNAKLLPSTGYSLPEQIVIRSNGLELSGSAYTYSSATGDIVITNGVTAPTEIIANALPNSYTVKFDPSGGTGTMGDQSFTYDAAQALTANAFKKDGYSFAGWSTTENGITAKYSDKESVSNLTAEQGGTVTLYAVWTEKATAGLAFAKAEITKGYGDAPFTNELTKATDATVTYTSSNESIATVDADGRATIVGLGDTTITATAVETGTHAAGSASYSLHVGKGTQSAPTGLTAQSCAAPGDTGSISGLTAAMEYKRSDSTGDYIPCPDGGSLTNLAAGTYLIRYAATELYEPGADATLVIAPYIKAEISRLTAANGSVTAVLKDAPTDIPAKENWTLVYHLSDSVSAYPLDVTAYQYDAGTRTAQFSFSPIPRTPQAQEVTVSVSISGSTQECSFTVDRQTTYTVQFDGNGGEGEMAEQSFYYDVVQRLSNNTYSLRNSVFAGWSTSRGGSVVYQDNAPVSRLEAIDGGIITLYAVWTDKALSGLTFQSREITVRYGEAAQANPLSKDTDAAAVYTSGNPAVATVDPDSGAITITGVGRAVITATVAETDDYASGAASYTLQVDKGLQGKPTGLTGHDSVDADSAGSITGVTTAMEYRASTASVYTSCTGDSLTGLSAGDYLIRYAETALYEAGEPVTVTIRKTTTGGGGGGGGGGGSAVEEPAPTAPPATSGSSTVLEPESTVENGKASSTLDADTADKLVEQAAKSGSTEIVVKPAISTDDAGKVTQAVVELPASAVADMAEKTEAALKVETPVASITLPNESLASLAGTAGGSVAISAARQADGAVKVELRSGGKAVDRLDGGLTVTLPVEDAAPGTVAMLVKADGTTEVIKKSALLDGSLVVPLEGSATVKLVDNSKAFSDVDPDDWYGGAVAFASAHELFSGTGDGSFDPGRPMDRGMLVTVLHRLENTPQGGSALFDDVAADAYYADAVAWAAENGIVTGNGSGFDPQGAVSREQLAVMLYRYASREGAGAAGSLDGFRDADAVSPWAADAMAWAVGAGLIQGDPSAGLNPGGSATRAEVAAILQRFITAAAQNQL